MKKVVFDEPNFKGGINRIVMSIEEAVLTQKKSASLSNYYYLYDKDALDDFLITYSAWIEETVPRE